MTRCPLCGSAQRPFVRRDGLAVVRCGRCTLGALTGGDAAANDVYEDVYRAPADAHPLTLERYDELLALLAPFRAAHAALLEIGFGDGSLLRRARERGWTVIGTETAAQAVRRLADDGIDARLGEHAARTVEPGSCDAVVMLEVLEHVADPLEALDEAHDALRPGGALLLSTPNADSVTRRLIGGRWRVFADEHRWYFTPRSLRRAFARAGLRTASLRSRNIYPPEIWNALRPARASAGQGSGAVTASSSRLREFSRRSAVGRAARASLNAVLSATGTGDTLWALAIRA